MLVVDDDELIQNILHKHLADFGLEQIYSALNGVQARTALASHPKLGLVILDLSMPKLDGVALIKDIARFHPGTSLIISSSQEESVLRTTRLLAESVGIRVLGDIRKPLRKSVLYGLLSMGERHIPAAAGTSPPPQKLPDENVILRSLGNLVMYYQPKMCLKSGDVYGCEALARLRFQSDTGRSQIVFPDNFIPLFERHGRVKELTLSVISKALDGMAEFAALGLNLGIAINLSMQDLEYDGLPEFIADQLQHRHISPDRVTFEITETSIPRDISACMESVSRLRLVGCDISIDDFGTGYSSLKQLRQLPFNELKIDREFVSKAINDPSALAIIEACIGIAKAFRIRTVAEGIESEEEEALLRKLDCDLAQGYFYAKALPESEFIHWCRSVQSR